MPLRLSISNFDAFKNSISLDAFPKAFKDALKITFQLGISIQLRFLSWSWAAINKAVIPRGPKEEDNTPIIRIVLVDVPLLGKEPLVKTTIRRYIGRYSNQKWCIGATSLANVFADQGHFADDTTILCLTINAKAYSCAMNKYGLILQATNKAQGQFYRRGYFAVFDLEDGDSYMRDFDDLHEAVLEPQYYEEDLVVDSMTRLHFYRFSII